MEWKFPTKIYKSIPATSSRITIHHSYRIKFSKPPNVPIATRVNVYITSCDFEERHMTCHNFIPDGSDIVDVISPVLLSNITSVLVSPEEDTCDVDWVQVADKLFIKSQNEFLDNRILFTLVETPKFDQEKYEKGMVVYETEKADILQTTLALAVGGTVLIEFMSILSKGEFTSFPILFLIGGLVGYLNQKVLQMRVDGIGKGDDYNGGSLLGWLQIGVIIYALTTAAALNPKSYGLLVAGFFSSKIATCLVASRHK